MRDWLKKFSQPFGQMMLYRTYQREHSSKGNIVFMYFGSVVHAWRLGPYMKESIVYKTSCYNSFFVWFYITNIAANLTLKILLQIYVSALMVIRIMSSYELFIQGPLRGLWIKRKKTNLLIWKPGLLIMRNYNT